MQALAVDSYAILMTLKFCLVSVQAAIYAVLVRYLPNPALHLAGRLLKAAQIPAVLTQSSCCHHFRTRWRPDGDAAGCSLGHLWHWGDWFPTICGCLSRHHRACGASGRTCDSGLSEGLSFILRPPEASCKVLTALACGSRHHWAGGAGGQGRKTLVCRNGGTAAEWQPEAACKCLCVQADTTGRVELLAKVGTAGFVLCAVQAAVLEHRSWRAIPLTPQASLQPWLILFQREQSVKTDAKWAPFCSAA